MERKSDATDTMLRMCLLEASSFAAHRTITANDKGARAYRCFCVRIVSTLGGAANVSGRAFFQNTW